MVKKIKLIEILLVALFLLVLGYCCQVRVLQDQRSNTEREGLQ